MTAGTKKTRGFAQYFVTAVAGNPAEGVVNIDNSAVVGGDHNAFSGMAEDTGGEAKLFFGLFALGNISRHTKYALHITALNVVWAGVIKDIENFP